MKVQIWYWSKEDTIVRVRHWNKEEKNPMQYKGFINHFKQGLNFYIKSGSFFSNLDYMLAGHYQKANTLQEISQDFESVKSPLQ